MCFKVGDKIKMRKNTGFIRYIGEILEKEGQWIGIELEDDCGKNDGTWNGVRYFDTKGRQSGIFIKYDKFVSALERSTSENVNINAQNENSGQKYIDQNKQGNFEKIFSNDVEKEIRRYSLSNSDEENSLLKPQSPMTISEEERKLFSDSRLINMQNIGYSADLMDIGRQNASESSKDNQYYKKKYRKTKVYLKAQERVFENRLESEKNKYKTMIHLREMEIAVLNEKIKQYEEKNQKTSNIQEDYNKLKAIHQNLKTKTKRTCSELKKTIVDIYEILQRCTILMSKCCCSKQCVNENVEENKKNIESSAINDRTHSIKDIDIEERVFIIDLLDKILQRFKNGEDFFRFSYKLQFNYG
ncbi:hypothetical protein EDEG_02923 [Edhazardia aedis USNM 41457]|uniref:CAP-Gly domain-containing protein n=1 Tax=Edhazardia aedis (strain USNM 41457) TaxID=1003232 RepID=J9D4G4_EDHAE|nr:hypothetical protein EDEG_02923 [Edhazardia aedis USNM 41457]|eukprot:EJW02691.1 hypothetical protein EDEG_02923 [Edhazardia aedis USNM 41457]